MSSNQPLRSFTVSASFSRSAALPATELLHCNDEIGETCALVAVEQMTAGLCNIFCTGKKGQIFEAANLLADDFDEALHVEAVNESLNGLISPVMALDCLPNVGDDKRVCLLPR